LRLLLDTHTFLWFVGGHRELSPRARQLIDDTANETWLSIVSVWEIAVKVSIGKMH
jgi:PIN domain nuclease of toxin-antitoxin system